MSKIFISQATVDKPLVEAVEGLLESGIGFAHHEVFCTSLQGQSIPDGEDFKSYIRKELETSDAVIALITPNYYASAFCMCELGAVWAWAKNFFPILVPPVDFKDLRGILTGMQCRKLLDKGTTDALYDRLAKLVNKPVPVERWNTKKDVFVRTLPNLLKQLPEIESISVDEHKLMSEELERYRALAVQVEEELDKCKTQVKELASAKDHMDVIRIRQKYSTEWETYESLRNDCRTKIGKLPRLLRESLYYWTRKQAFQPDYTQWGEDITRALENDQLTEAPHEQYQFWPNDERPDIREAMTAIKKLRKFLDETSSEGFSNEFIGRTGDTANIERRSFWDKQLW